MSYKPTIHVNGVPLVGAKITEDFDISGMFVRAVHIEAPKFEIRVKEENE